MCDDRCRCTYDSLIIFKVSLHCGRRIPQIWNYKEVSNVQSTATMWYLKVLMDHSDLLVFGFLMVLSDR